MANFKNTIFRIATAHESLPLSSNGTGTISTVGTAIKGVGTKFKTEMPVGSWLVKISADEVRKVIQVDSDTLAYMTNAFTADIIAGATPSIIHSKYAHPVALSVKAVGAAGTVDGQVLASGESVTFSKDSRDHSAHRDLIDPITISGTNMQTLILY